MYFYKKLPSDDRELAGYYYREACERRDEMACYRLASSDLSMSEMAFDERACEDGLVSACFTVKMRCQAGEGVPIDLEKAALYEEKACALDHNYCTDALLAEREWGL